MFHNIDLLELVSLAACFVLSGFFSGSEAVLMSIAPDRARQMIEQGGQRGKALRFMVEKSNEMLATILIGNNIVNILAASLVTAISSRIFQSDAIGISVGVTTIIILIFGEVIPKAFARTHAEKLALPVIKILQFLYYFTMFPLVKGMVWIMKTVLGENAEISGRVITKNDIEYLVNKAEKEQTIDSKQIDLLNSILEFPTIKVKDIMIPRKEVKSVDLETSYEDILNFVREDGFSRYPVFKDDLDSVLGFLHVKDLAFATSENFDMKSILKEPFFVYEHMRIQAVFDYMNRKKVHLALVKDETGLLVGIVTLEDIVEEILGEIQDEHDDEEENTAVATVIEGITVEGGISLRDLYNEFDIKIPLNDNYSTLAGFVLDMLGNNFPESGQIIVWEGLSFELSRVDEFEIREIKIKDVDGEKHIYSKKKASDQKALKKKNIKREKLRLAEAD